MLSLTTKEIMSIKKSLLIKKFNSYIRLWYISGNLPQCMIKDPEVIPYFTPCSGHPNSSINTTNVDVIDGVLQMQAYCDKCIQLHTH